MAIGDDNNLNGDAEALPADPIYDVEEVAKLFLRLPYTQMMRASSGLYLLKRQAAAIEAWGEYLPQYRTLLCERLDFAYLYLRCLGALDISLLHDLLFTRWFTWRGVVIGSWLSALEPRQEFHELLRQARPRAPKNQWAVDFALAAIEGTRPPEVAEHLGLMETITQALRPIPRPATTLRRYDASQFHL